MGGGAVHGVSTLLGKHTQFRQLSTTWVVILMGYYLTESLHLRYLTWNFPLGRQGDSQSLWSVVTGEWSRRVEGLEQNTRGYIRGYTSTYVHIYVCTSIPFPPHSVQCTMYLCTYIVSLAALPVSSVFSFLLSPIRFAIKRTSRTCMEQFSRREYIPNTTDP